MPNRTCSRLVGPADRTLAATAKTPKTAGGFKPIMIGFGERKFEKAGVYHLTLQPADPAAWKTVCVWQIQMAPVPAATHHPASESPQPADGGG